MFRTLIAAAALALAVLAGPAVASAALTVTGADLDGATSVSSMNLMKREK